MEQLGGTLEESLVLNDQGSPYIVKNDLIILSNGSLTIAPNVTLIFPQRSAFMVQGHVSVEGTVTNQVKFLLEKTTSNKLRLVRGAGRWAGRVEMLYNKTWMSVCRYCGSDFTKEAQVICWQLGYNYYR